METAASASREIVWAFDLGKGSLGETPFPRWGDGAARHPYHSKDVLGRVYEYFLGKFASAEGKGGGEFYTPQCVVQVLVAMLEP